MAITKKHLKIQGQKIVVRDQIEAQYLAGKEAVKRVPDFVLAGKQQIAIEWKRLAELFVNMECPRGPKSATLPELKDLLAFRSQQVAGLCGKRPLL